MKLVKFKGPSFPQFLALELYILILFACPAYSQESDIEYLTRFIAENNVHSLSELLEKMNERQEMPQEHLAVYKTRSSQPASVLNPRILMLWRNNSILGFHGQETKDDFNQSIEFMTFNKEKKEFELYYIKIPPKGEGDFSASTHVEKNPKKCMGCHNAIKDGQSQRVRFIWDSYFIWPGYYGSHDGKLTGSEVGQYLEYEKSRQSHPLYRHLPRQDKLLSTAREGYRGLGIRYQLADFGGKVFEDQQKVVIKDILGNPHLEKFRYAILGAVACPFQEFPIESFIPEPLLQDDRFRFAQNPFESVFQDTMARNDHDFKRRYDQIVSLTGTDSLGRANSFLSTDKEGVYRVYSHSPESTALISRVRYIVDNVWDKDMSVWSMGFLKSSKDLSFAHGRFNFDNPGAWQGLLKDEVVDRELAQLLEADMSSTHKVAEGLKEKERQRIRREILDPTAAEDRIRNVDARSDLQMIFDNKASQFSKVKGTDLEDLFYEEFIGTQGSSGHILTLKRAQTCKKLQERSKEHLSSLIESKSVVKFVSSALGSLGSKLRQFCPWP